MKPDDIEALKSGRISVAAGRSAADASTEWQGGKVPARYSEEDEAAMDEHYDVLQWNKYDNGCIIPSGSETPDIPRVDMGGYTAPRMLHKTLAAVQLEALRSLRREGQDVLIEDYWVEYLGESAAALGAFAKPWVDPMEFSIADKLRAYQTFLDCFKKSAALSAREVWALMLQSTGMGDGEVIVAAREAGVALPEAPTGLVPPTVKKARELRAAPVLVLSDSTLSIARQKYKMNSQKKRKMWQQEKTANPRDALQYATGEWRSLDLRMVPKGGARELTAHARAFHDANGHLMRMDELFGRPMYPPGMGAMVFAMGNELPWIETRGEYHHGMPTKANLEDWDELNEVLSPFHWVIVYDAPKNPKRFAEGPHYRKAMDALLDRLTGENITIVNCEWCWRDLKPWLVRNESGYTNGYHVGEPAWCSARDATSYKLVHQMDTHLMRGVWLGTLVSLAPLIRKVMRAQHGGFHICELPPAREDRLALGDTAGADLEMPSGGPTRIPSEGAGAVTRCC